MDLPTYIETVSVTVTKADIKAALDKAQRASIDLFYALDPIGPQVDLAGSRQRVLDSYRAAIDLLDPFSNPRT